MSFVAMALERAEESRRNDLFVLGNRVGWR
jgi:hypothetical protein